MRLAQQQHQSNQVATQLRRQAELGSAATRNEIVSQAQTRDAQGQTSQFFYNSTIQEATAVTKALKARFTYVAVNQGDMPEPPVVNHPAEELKGGTNPINNIQNEKHWRLETNLITFSSNVLKVYSLPAADAPPETSASVDLRLSNTFNGRILDVIRVPTEPFLRDEYLAQQMQMQAVQSNENKKRKNVMDGNQPSAREIRSSKRKQRGGTGDAAEQQQQMIDTTDGNKSAIDEAALLQKPAVTADLAANAPDYLFVILANFTVALICYSRRDHRIEVVSRGNISEKILHDQKEPPYPIFLGQTGTFIVLMLYHNILKVIPLVREPESSQHLISLTHAAAARVRHSNVMQVVPLYHEGNPFLPTFGVVYQRTDHIRIPGASGPPALSIKIELEKQIFDLDHKDLTPHAKNGGKLEFTSNSVYRIEPLTFGGFLAFDLDTVSYFRKELQGNSGAYHQQLKSAHQISAFCQVDEYDIERGTTTTDSPYVRYLFATEAGELFMLAIQVETLNEILSGNALVPTDALINIEFLASKLTFCSSLVYLDDSLVFYSSKEGDSFILRICAEHQGNQDQPYITVQQRFTSLAPIMDLQLARPENTQGQQSELVIVGGWNHQTNMNMVKQGVGLRSIKSFESVLPSDLVQEFYTCGDKVFMRMYGYDQLIGMSAKQKATSGPDQGVIAVDGFDVSRNFAIKPNEQILALEGVTLQYEEPEPINQVVQEPLDDAVVQDASGNQPMIIDNEEVKAEKSLNLYVYATDNSIKVLNQGTGEQTGNNIYCELQPEGENNKFTLVKLSDDNLVVAQFGGLIKHLKLSLAEDGITVHLTELARIDMGAEISAMCIADDCGIDAIYVTLSDAPHYSLNVISMAQEGRMRLLARMPLSSVLEMAQTKKFYQYQLVKGGHIFTQFNHSGKSRQQPMLQNLPSQAQEGNQDSAGVPDERMEVDASAAIIGQAQSSLEIPMQFNCAAAQSIEHLSIKSQDTDQIIIGFANGKLMQLCIDLAHIRGIINDPENYEPFLDFQLYVEARLNVENSNPDSDQMGKGHEDLNIEHCGPFWGAQVSYVGTIHPKMRKIRTDQDQEAVIACCDRPVVFYEADQSIEMHYLAYKHIRDIAYLTATSSSTIGTPRPFLIYEDNQGILHLSENDNLRRLQVQRMVFKMQITKTLLIPSNDSIIVLLEQPNMDYIDSSKQACNVVGLVSRSTMRTQAIFRLQKGEIANCAYSIDSTLSKQGVTGQRNTAARKWLLVGTAFLNPEETIPSMGRLLMLEADTMNLVQEFQVNGSLQSLLLTDYNKYLILGVNNQIQAYDFGSFMPTMRMNTGTIQKLGKLELLCQKSSGTFIQSIVKLVSPNATHTPDDLAESLVVGDMTGRGVSTFELKDCRQTKVKIVESASTHISLWVNSIVALSDSQFIVFDNDGNLFIFQKNLYPTCIEEKLKLTLKGSFCIGEEVQSAAFGSFRSTTMQQTQGMAETRGGVPEGLNDTEMNTRQKKKQYVNRANVAQIEATAAAGSAEADEKMAEDEEDNEERKEEQVMIVTRGSVAKQLQKQQKQNLGQELVDPTHFGKVLKDLEFARRFAHKTLEEMQHLQAQKCSIVYGTTDGSLGCLFQIPPKVYLLLQLLQHEMDSHVNTDLVSQKRSEYRSVKQTPATSIELQQGKSILNGIIDGDLVEVFLDLPKNKKLEYAKGMLGHTGKGDEEFTDFLTQIISLMKKTH